MIANDQLNNLIGVFGDRLRTSVPMDRFTSSRIGGQAEFLLEVRDSEELKQAVTVCWQARLPLHIIGGGSNVLVSDKGIAGIVIINRTHLVRFDDIHKSVKVWAESGVNLGLLARQCASRGLTGLEWAAGIPGTLGGAVVGNAGAHGEEMKGSVILAEILHRIDLGQEVDIRKEDWPVERLEYGYRSSILKKEPGQSVVLGALLGAKHGSPEIIQKSLDELVEYRHRTQPPGASMGSMFKILKAITLAD